MRADPDRPAADEPARFEVPMSMIDVVFLLLIFFMCVSSFRRPEQRLETDMILNSPGPPPPPVSRVTVRIRMDGDKAVITAQDYPCEDLNDLAAKLARLAGNLPELKVLVDGRSDVPFRYVVGAMDACGRARVTDVSLMSPVASGGGSDFWHQ